MQSRTAYVLVSLSACLSFLRVASGGGTATVSTTRDLLAAFGNISVHTIFLNDTLVLDGSIWNTSAGVSANITRSLTLTAGPNHLFSKTYVLLDFNNLDALFSLAPGCLLRFVGLEIRNHLERRGTFIKPLRQSVGAFVEFRSCVLRRHAGFPAAAEVINLLATHRPETPDGGRTVQECVVHQNLSYSTTGSTARVNVAEAVWLGNFATVVAEDSSLAFQGHQYGGYTYIAVQSYDVADSVVPQSCLDTAPGDKCLLILLQQLEPPSLPSSPSSLPTTTSRWPHSAEIMVACIAAAAAVLALAVVLAGLVLARRRCSSSQRSRNPYCRCWALLPKHLALAFSRHRSSKNAGCDAVPAAEGCDAAAPNVGSGGGGGGGGGLVSDSLLDGEEEQRRRWRRRRLRGADDEGVEAPLPPSDHCYSLSRGPPNLFVAVAAMEGTSAVAATAAAGPGAASWNTAITAQPRSAVASYAPRDAAGGARAAVTATATIGGSSNASGDHSCVFLGLDPGQRLPHGSVSVMEQPQDVGFTSRRCGRLSTGVATSLTSSPSYQQPLSLRGLGVTVGASGCGRSASVSGNGDGVGVSGSGYDDLLQRGPRGNRTTPHTRYGSGVNSEDFTRDRGYSGSDDGVGHRQYSWYGNGDGSVGGDGHARDDGHRQSVSDSNSELDPAASFNVEYESGGGGGGPSAAVRTGAAGLAAVTAAFAELDGSSKRKTVSELGGLSIPNSQPANQHSINAPQLRLEGVLGCGSWGTVYRGTWNGIAVAVKTLVFSAAADDDARRRALREATLSASVSHPNIISIYSAEMEPLPGGQWCSRPVGLPATALAAVGAGGRLLDGFVPPPPPTAATAAAASPSPLQTAKRRLSASAIGEGSGSSDGAGGGGAAIMDWRLYIIQEFADAGPLAEVYGDLDLWPVPGAPNLPSVVALALGIASALSYLHSKRIIHGDLNPNNVLLKRDSRESSGLVVKVADFGLRWGRHHRAAKVFDV
ncbi:hypothetical protein Vafri_14080 [Volvox africanus]|uniref:Protein kinase domain-containing protein n=1 Tax=Volvox africanus TaxID=51714 RepID=A0A8J4BDB8_9CHLO|nr:hypothetical protein Vafri_14080 [Volvox africanus]